MSSNRRIYAVLAGCFLCGALLAAPAQTASVSNEGVTTWWPDVQNGIIWTGQEVNGKKDETYDQSVQLCNALVVGAMSGWRLPTIGEWTA